MVWLWVCVWTRLWRQWALGVTLYEFLYGRPPFNADSPVEIFANILARRLDFSVSVEDDGDDMEDDHDGARGPSPAARDLIDKLLCLDPRGRLGSTGAAAVRAHPFFKGLDWTRLAATPAMFIPRTAGTEDTAYFDARGATVEQLERELLGNAASERRRRPRQGPAPPPRTRTQRETTRACAQI
jgi:serine/threonine-protein kinase RIM15